MRVLDDLLRYNVERMPTHVRRLFQSHSGLKQNFGRFAPGRTRVRMVVDVMVNIELGGK